MMFECNSRCCGRVYANLESDGRQTQYKTEEEEEK